MGINGLTATAVSDWQAFAASGLVYDGFRNIDGWAMEWWKKNTILGNLKWARGPKDHWALQWKGLNTWGSQEWVALGWGRFFAWLPLEWTCTQSGLFFGGGPFASWHFFRGFSLVGLPILRHVFPMVYPSPRTKSYFQQRSLLNLLLPLCCVQKPSNPPPYKKTRSIPQFSLKRFPPDNSAFTCPLFLDDFLWPFHSKAKWIVTSK